MAKEANHPVRTSQKTLGLIQKLDELGGARIFELEEELDMTKGAIHNHLSTLREEGFVIEDAKEYRLSLKFLSLGARARKRMPLYEFGVPKVDQLAEDTGMLSNLMCEEGGRGVYLYQSRGNYAVYLDTHVGYEIRLHNIAIGKAILAFLPRERVDEIISEWGLPATTENTITDPDTLHEELTEIKEQGYATEREERTQGLSCIGAPVLLDKKVLGAMSISAPTKRLYDEDFDPELTATVQSSASDLALDVKYR